MEIRQLIKGRLLSEKFSIFDTKGQEIAPKVFLSDYIRARNYLASLQEQDFCVGIKLSKDYHYLMVMLACMESGIPYVPMKENYPDDRVKQIHEESGFTLLVDASKLEEILKTEIVDYQEKNFPLMTPSTLSALLAALADQKRL